jgi:hypothetical protein
MQECFMAADTANQSNTHKFLRVQLVSITMSVYSAFLITNTDEYSWRIMNGHNSGKPACVTFTITTYLSHQPCYCDNSQTQYSTSETRWCLHYNSETTVLKGRNIPLHLTHHKKKFLFITLNITLTLKIQHHFSGTDRGK